MGKENQPPVAPQSQAAPAKISPTKRDVLARTAKELWEKTPNVIFVDSSRREWPARIKPVPVNKYQVVTLPGVRDMEAEYRAIDAMPLQDRVAAFAALQERNARGQSALAVSEKRYDNICEFKGVVMYQTKTPTGNEPICNLLVNFAASEEYEDWQTLHNMRHVRYVGRTAQGHQIPHWKFGDERDE